MISQAGMIDQVIFKSDASPAEVNAFMARDSRIIYQHIIDDGRTGDFDQFTRLPAAFEINYDRLTDAQIQPAFIDRVRAKARIFANTMWRGLSAGYTDEASLIDPANGWETVIDRHHASVIHRVAVRLIQSERADIFALFAGAASMSCCSAWTRMRIRTSMWIILS